MDVNNIPEEFVNYFDGLAEEGKRRIIDARPDLAAILGVRVTNEIKSSSDVVDGLLEGKSTTDIVETEDEEIQNEGEDNSEDEEEVVEHDSEILNNIYANKDMRELVNTSLSPVHELIIPD